MEADAQSVDWCDSTQHRILTIKPTARSVQFLVKRNGGTDRRHQLTESMKPMRTDTTRLSHTPQRHPELPLTYGHCWPISNRRQLCMYDSVYLSWNELSNEHVPLCKQRAYQDSRLGVGGRSDVACTMIKSIPTMHSSSVFLVPSQFNQMPRILAELNGL